MLLPCLSVCLSVCLTAVLSPVHFMSNVSFPHCSYVTCICQYGCEALLHSKATVQATVSILQFTNSSPANKVGTIKIWEHAVLLANTNESKPLFSSVLLPISRSFTSRLIFYVGKFQVLFCLSFCFSLFTFSYVQCGCAAGASVSTAELQQVPTPPAAQCVPTVLNFTLLTIYIIVIVSCSSLGSMWQMVTCWRLAEIKKKNKTKQNGTKW